MPRKKKTTSSTSGGTLAKSGKGFLAGILKRKSAYTGGTLTTKNHVVKHSPVVNSVLKSTFGWDLSDFDSMLKANDMTALQSLANHWEESQIARQLLPIVKQAYLDIYGHTAEYNKAVADIITQGANNKISIDRDVNRVMMAERKFKNQRSELALELSNSRKMEGIRHDYALNLATIKGTVERMVFIVENNAKALQMSAQPALKQIDADKQYQIDSVMHVLENGSRADLSLLPQKQYGTVTGGKGILNTVRGWMGV